MKPLKQENLKELTEKVLDLVAKTSVEIGHRADAQTLASVHTLGKPKGKTLWYQEPLKLLK